VVVGREEVEEGTPESEGLSSSSRGMVGVV